MKISFIIESVVFIGLNLADVWLTNYALGMNGFIEINPLFSSGVADMMLIKALGITVIIGVAYYLGVKKNIQTPLYWPNCLFCFVVIWNSSQILLR